MAINIMTINGKTVYDTYEYVCDFETDVKNLPVKGRAGSRAYIVETGKIYILNTQKKWIAINRSSGGGSGSGTDEDIPSGGGTLISKTITQNGIYNASSDNADGYDVVTVDVPQGPYEVMNDYIEGTLTRLRLNNVPSGRLKYIQPGGSSSGSADQTIQRIELPNNTDALGVWQFGNMQNLLFFDSGYTPAFSNVCLAQSMSLKWVVVRKGDLIPTLHSHSTISLSAAGRIAVTPELIEDYKNGTNWSYWADRFRNLYFANSNDELEELLLDGAVPNESMIVCDYNETYYVKGEGVV